MKRTNYAQAKYLPYLAAFREVRDYIEKHSEEFSA